MKEYQSGLKCNWYKFLKTLNSSYILNFKKHVRKGNYELDQKENYFENAVLFKMLQNGITSSKIGKEVKMTSSGCE